MRRRYPHVTLVYHTPYGSVFGRMEEAMAEVDECTPDTRRHDGQSDQNGDCRSALDGYTADKCPELCG